VIFVTKWIPIIPALHISTYPSSKNPTFDATILFVEFITFIYPLVILCHRSIKVANKRYKQTAISLVSNF